MFSGLFPENKSRRLDSKSDVWRCLFLPIQAVLCEFPLFIDFSDPISRYHLLSTLMTSFYGFLEISISMDLVSISLDFIHVFECEFSNWLFLQSSL